MTYQGFPVFVLSAPLFDIYKLLKDNNRWSENRPFVCRYVYVSELRGRMILEKAFEQ